MVRTGRASLVLGVGWVLMGGGKGRGGVGLVRQGLTLRRLTAFRP
jgi:hypothetical protein